VSIALPWPVVFPLLKSCIFEVSLCPSRGVICHMVLKPSYSVLLGSPQHDLPYTGLLPEWTTN
jgi:hypothetical protein